MFDLRMMMEIMFHMLFHSFSKPHQKLIRQLIVVFLIVVIILMVLKYLDKRSKENQYYRQFVTEGFDEKGGWDLASSTNYENAHGSAPAGVNALPGDEQYRQNSAALHVDHANKTGNPQNTFPELKKQPLFSY
jgi:hypothetical protein